MLKSVRAALLGALFAIGGAASPLHADTMALDFSSAPISTFVFDDATVGWTFTLNSAVTLTALGIWDVTGLGESHFPAGGLQTAHTVGLWDSSGNLVAQANLDASTATIIVAGEPDSDGRWVFRSIASVNLAPGAYTLGATYQAPGPEATETNQESIDWFAVQADGVSTPSQVTYGQSVYNIGTPLTQPTTHFTDYNKDPAYFGPNLLFTSATSAVPEPASWALMIAGFAGLGFARRRRLAAVQG